MKASGEQPQLDTQCRVRAAVRAELPTPGSPPDSLQAPNLCEPGKPVSPHPHLSAHPKPTQGAPGAAHRLGGPPGDMGTAGALTTEGLTGADAAN